MNDVFTHEVSAIAFGGQGIVKNEGLVVFIPFTAVGDVVCYRIVKRKKNFAWGEVVEIVVPSKIRVIPPCPYYGKCGGCQLQHVQYNAQLEYKQQWIEDALRRQAQFKDLELLPLLPSEQKWNYRRRISLLLKPHHSHFQVGYTGVDHKELIEPTECQIFTYPNDPIFTFLQKLASSLEPSDNNEGKVTLLKSGNEKYILHFHFKSLQKNALKLLRSSLGQENISGILATSPKQTLEFGQLETTCEVEKLTFTFSPKAFIQNHPEQSANIYRRLLEVVSSENQGNLLDLYCGIGISSILLSKNGFNVCGIESNGEAIRLAKLNAKYNQIAHINFIKDDVEKALDKQLKSFKPEVIVCNPPREGLSSDITRLLLNYKPSTIIYISCMPPTLARDLKLLSALYKITQIQAFDMFPQTTHLETCVKLKRLD